MQKISLRKRILFYVALFFLTLIIGLMLSRALCEYSGIEGNIYFVILVFLLPHCLISAVFWKTKWIIKLIVPFVTAIISFGIICCGTNFFVVLFLPIVFVWEITYQILIRCLKRTEKLEENPI